MLSSTSATTVSGSCSGSHAEADERFTYESQHSQSFNTNQRFISTTFEQTQSMTLASTIRSTFLVSQQPQVRSAQQVNHVKLQQRQQYKPRFSSRWW